jgi:hypothetical protein
MDLYLSGMVRGFLRAGARVAGLTISAYADRKLREAMALDQGVSDAA